MLIDWFTVLAQIINFLVLVWLLKRYLYKPILNAVYAREKLVKDQLALADEKMAATETLMAEYNDKTLAFEKEKEANLKRVSEEVAQVKTELLANAKKDYEQLSQKQKEALVEAEKQLQKELVQKSQKEVLKIVRKTLEVLATEELEKYMVQVFTQRLQQLDACEKDLLKSSVNVSDKAICIRSAYEIAVTEQRALKQAIDQVLHQDIQLIFENKPELISGIELITDGYRLSWNTDEYLRQIDKKAQMAEKNRDNT